MMTTGVVGGDYCYQIYDHQYDGYTRSWVCSVCRNSYPKKNKLQQHLASGVHEEKRYACQDCGRQFPSLGGLTQHLEATGHAKRESRLVNVMLNDAQQTRLLLTNGVAPSNFECTMYFDGSAPRNPGYSGSCGWSLKDHRGVEFAEGGRRFDHFEVTNNKMEYEGLIGGLQAAIDEGVKRLKVHGDSELVINHVNGVYHCNAVLQPFLSRVRTLQRSFQRIEFEWIPRSQNSRADYLADYYYDNDD